MKKTFTVITLIIAMLLCSCAGTEEISSSTDAATGSITQTDAPATAATETDGTITEPMTSEPMPAEPVPTEPAPTEPDEPEVAFPAVEYSEDGYLPKALMYHLVLEEPYNYNTGLFVRPTDLEDQIKTLLDAGYIFLFADEYGKTKEKSVVLTFDDGYVDNCTELLPILKKYNVKATVYIIGDLVDNHPEYLTREQIKEMADSGYIQFGCHTMSHPYLTGLTDEEIKKEYSDCIALIKEFTAQDCRTIAYPYGSYDTRVTAITKEYFDFAYNSGYYPPDDDDLNYYISRYYIERGIDGAGLLAMIDH